MKVFWELKWKPSRNVAMCLQCSLKAGMVHCSGVGLRYGISKPHVTQGPWAESGLPRHFNCPVSNGQLFICPPSQRRQCEISKGLRGGAGLLPVTWDAWGSGGSTCNPPSQPPLGGAAHHLTIAISSSSSALHMDPGRAGSSFNT